MKHINQQEWKELLSEDNNAVILDVRTPEEQAEGIIKNAICLDIYKPEEFISGLEKLDKTKNYYVYCKAGGRSANACQVMDQMGFVQTYNLLGGVSLWTGELV
ncbi:MAG: rhodanese-like domain-containing protein [Flavobacteriaceae bacterium]